MSRPWRPRVSSHMVPPGRDLPVPSGREGWGGPVRRPRDPLNRGTTFDGSRRYSGRPSGPRCYVPVVASVTVSPPPPPSAPLKPQSSFRPPSSGMILILSPSRTVNYSFSTGSDLKFKKCSCIDPSFICDGISVTSSVQSAEYYLL